MFGFQIVFSLLLVSFAPQVEAFTLISETYKLSNPEDTVVNLASGACRGNGIPDSEIFGAVENSIAYWNEVTGSRLQFRVGAEVSRSINDDALPGEILFGCGALGPNANGVSIKNDENGSAVVVLNNTYTPGSYNPGAIELTVIHELGHALGLGHSNDSGAVMVSGSLSAQLPDALGEDDKEGVRYLYPVEGYLGGLLGGCSALASDGDTGSHRGIPWSSLLLELLFFGFLVLLLRRRQR